MFGGKYEVLVIIRYIYAFFFLLQQKQNIIMAFKYFLLRLENKSHETDKQIKMTVTLN